MTTRIRASGNQERYVLAELSKAGSYMIPLGHKVEGRLDLRAFKAACAALVKRHEALRTRFVVENGAVHAIVAEDGPFEFHSCTMEDPSIVAFRSWALPRIFDRVDPLKAGSLCRILVADYGTSWRFTVAAHHAITDGFSRGTINRDLLKLYVGETLPEARAYSEFARPAAREDAISEAGGALIAALPPSAQLVGDGVAEDGPTDGRYVTQKMPTSPAELRRLAKALGTTKFGVLTAIYGLTLPRFGLGDALASCFQTEGRTRLGAPTSVVGPFSNTLPLDTDVPLDLPFSDAARCMAERTKATVALEHEPLLEAAIKAGKAPTVSINLFPPAKRILAGDLTIGPREFLDRRTEYDLNVVWSEDEGELTAQGFYDAAKLSEERTQTILGFIARLLSAAVADPNRTCHDLLQAARARQESHLPRPQINEGPETRFHTAFFETARRTPDAIAIHTSMETLTYAALAERALDVVGSLQTAGVGPSDRVAIIGEKGISLVAAMLGISASGASFAILDAAYPKARLQALLADLGAPFVLVAGPEAATDGLHLPKLVTVEPGAGSSAKIIDGPPRAEACHLFTSGTTGRPKLKTHPDQTLQRFIAWQKDTMGLDEPPRTMMLSGVAHDPTLRDVFLPLSFGGTIAIPTAAELQDPSALRALMTRACYNVVRLSPTTARLLKAGREVGAVLPSLQGIFWGGERLTHGDVAAWRALAPNARQFHVFGTTETPQAFLVHNVQGSDTRRRHVPLGRPLPWTGVRIIDEMGAPVAYGEVGEIVAELSDPVVGVTPPPRSSAGDPRQSHATGDFGYMTADGRSWFVGRRDTQIKVNDFRIEPSEIEAVAEHLPGVDRAQVVYADGALQLFVLAKRQDVSSGQVRAALANALPSYMVPGRVHVVDDFPATANGKTDTAALLAQTNAATPGPDRPKGHPPRGDAETAIAAVFARASGVEVTDRTLSLYDLGADSLASIEARIELEALGVDLPEDWSMRPLSDLAKAMRAPRASSTGHRGAFTWTRLEPYILIRAAAILVVVLNHSGFSVGGASIVLFTMAGYTFALQQLPGILRDDHAGRVLALLARLVIPLVPVTFLYVGFAYDLSFDFDLENTWTALLFIRNYEFLIDWLANGPTQANTAVIWLWFLHVYLQMFAIIGLLLAVPMIRRALARDIWRSFAFGFLVAEILALAVFGLVASSVGSLEDAGHLLFGSASTILPFLMLGAFCAAADTIPKRLASFIFVLGHFAISYTCFPDHQEVWWVLALLTCWLVPNFSMPRGLSNLIVWIAGYSLMIYLLHPAVLRVMRIAFGEGTTATAVSIMAQIAIGVAAGLILRPLLDRMGVTRLGRRRFSF